MCLYYNEGNTITLKKKLVCSLLQIRQGFNHVQAHSPQTHVLGTVLEENLENEHSSIYLFSSLDGHCGNGIQMHVSVIYNHVKLKFVVQMSLTYSAL